MIGTQSVLAVITARGGSKGLPGKNILPVGGRPLIQWTIDAARGSRYIDRLILSSDDPGIIDAAVRGGCEAPFTRSAVLSDDTASSADVVIDALERVPGYAIVVLLQPTSPLRLSTDIDGALELLQASGAPSCVSVREADDHPYWTFARAPDGQLTHFVRPPGGIPLRRQELPAAWCLNGAVYAARTAWFTAARNFLTNETVGFPMPAARSLDIDTAEDIETMKHLLRNDIEGRAR